MGVGTPASEEACMSVPMALGKHLFSFRTQQLSPAAAIILRKRETSTVPNYTITPGKARGFVLCRTIYSLYAKIKETSERASLFLYNNAIAFSAK